MKDCLYKFTIKGFQEVSLIDWEGKIASIIYLGGCNFRCGFCHSSSLVLGHHTIEPVPFNRIEEFLNNKKGWIDGVVISGGEPTLLEDELSSLISTVRSFGLSVKLDTNGTRPQSLHRLISEEAVDYVAMDIKAPLNKEAYERVIGGSVVIEDIIRSKDIILSSGIDHEFRTTVVPGLIDIPDIDQIAKSLIPAKRYYLQQFVPRNPIDPACLDIKPYPLTVLERMAAVASEHLDRVLIRRN